MSDREGGLRRAWRTHEVTGSLRLGRVDRRTGRRTFRSPARSLTPQKPLPKPQTPLFALFLSFGPRARGDSTSLAHLRKPFQPVWNLLSSGSASVVTFSPVLEGP